MSETGKIRFRSFAWYFACLCCGWGIGGIVVGIITNDARYAVLNSAVLAVGVANFIVYRPWKS
jgi:hypothetical protein